MEVMKNVKNKEKTLSLREVDSRFELNRKTSESMFFCKFKQNKLKNYFIL